MLSLCELRRAARILENALAGSALQRIIQADDPKLLLVFRLMRADHTVLLSCKPDFARICLAREVPQAARVPPSFVQYARAHMVRASFENIHVAERDRLAAIRLRTAEGIFEILLSIMGARSNIYLLDPQGKLAHAMRPLDKTRRELVLGEPWANPAGALRSEGIDRWEETPDDRYLLEIEQTYLRLERTRTIADIARKVESALDKEAGFLERKAVNLLEDLGEARQAEEHRRKGELLKSILHRIRPGDLSATAVDHQTGAPLIIELDPSLTPVENMETYFGRYQKELRGVAAIEQQLDAVRSARAAIDSLAARLRAILGSEEPDLKSLQDFARSAPVRKLLPRADPARKSESPLKKTAAKKDIPSRLLPKRYRTPDGLEVWVGRSDEGNDYLTTRLARGNDLFFHLEGYPGSHVVLRTEGRPDPPSESMLAACELAVHFSKLKNAGRADVHVAAIKDVKKPKGAKPGLVYVRKGRSIHLRRIPKRLEDILSSRIED